LPFKEKNRQVLVHIHCHQKALAGTMQTLEVLKGVAGFEVKEIESGCCGLAGSFGYEKEHYEFSMKIGDLHLFPAVRAANADALIVASGFSCSCQIDHGTAHKTVHLAEALADQLEEAGSQELVASSIH
jgi:Fe-S oxidoreductase